MCRQRALKRAPVKRTLNIMIIRAEQAFTPQPTDHSQAELLQSQCPTQYVWKYEAHKEDLRALYEKAKKEQWNGQTYLNWQISVDPEAELMPDENNPIFNTHVWHKMTKHEQGRFRREAYGWMLSQFMHGEQGALLTASQLVNTVPWIA